MCEFTVDKICNALLSICIDFSQFICLPLSLSLYLSFFLGKYNMFAVVLRKYTYWKCPPTSNVHPFHFNGRINATRTPRANRKFESAFPTDMSVRLPVCIFASVVFTCEYSDTRIGGFRDLR